MSVIRKHGQHHSQRPYDPPEGNSTKTGLFNKVRGFLFGDTNKDHHQSPSNGQSQVSKFNQPTQIAQERPPISPALFKKVKQVNTSFSPSSPSFSPVRDDVSIQQSPSARLAKFFTEKGDQPLSDIEVQGVLSLINQSARYQGDESTLPNTPKVLRPQTVEPIKSTPRYQPSFNSPANKSMDAYSTRKNRLIEFSSLPSPYRVRISSPLASLMSKQESKEIEKVAKKDTQKPLSETANALVGLLNQNQKKADPKPEPSRFANPYVSGLKKSKPSVAKPISSELPKVVEKAQEKPKISILEKMQQTAPNEELLETKNEPQDAPSTVLSKPEIPKQTQTFSPQNFTEEAKKPTPPSTVETAESANTPVFKSLSTAPSSESTPITEETKPLFSFTPSTQFSKPPPIQPSNGSSLTKGEPIAHARKESPPEELSVDSAQDSPQTHQPPVPVLLSQNKYPSIEYQFPTVEPKTLQLDPSKVAQYERSFVF